MKKYLNLSNVMIILVLVFIGYIYIGFIDLKSNIQKDIFDVYKAGVEKIYNVTIPIDKDEILREDVLSAVSDNNTSTCEEEFANNPDSILEDTTNNQNNKDIIPFYDDPNIPNSEKLTVLNLLTANSKEDASSIMNDFTNLIVISFSGLLGAFIQKNVSTNKKES